MDGQQRITTLYLLHWYIAQRIRKPSLLKEVTLGYHVRQYADEFTQKLSDENILIDFSSSIPSVAVCDCSWFFEAWKHDPTISGMLNTLDTIHELLKDKEINEERYWQLLKDGAVTFYWLDLEEHHLTDELYLKMNARGKQLSKFENFKASLVKRINDEQWESKEKVKETFSYKMDTTYTDLFWQYRGDQTVIDNEAMNFLAGMAMIAHALRDKSDHKRIDELCDYPLFVTASDFSAGDFELITEFLDLYSKPEDFYIDTPLWDKDFKADSGKAFFEVFVKDNASVYKQRVKQCVFFYAVSYLFIKVEDKDDREDFIRVVRNIIENTTIDSAQTFVSAIKLIHELFEGCYKKDEKIWINIYTYLNTEPKLKSSKYQIEQEIEQEIDKAKRIVADSQWKEAIWEAEDHPMFKGDIGFLLLGTENNLDLFKKRYEVAKEMFDENGVKGKYRENALLLRALISRFDSWYLFWDSLSLDSSSKTWKRFLKTDKRWVKYFILLLEHENELEQFIIEDSLLGQEYCSEEDFKIRRKTHINLYQTELLVAICEKCIFHWNSGNYILYPSNSKVNWNKYIVTHERNDKLSKSIEDSIITTEQQLEVNGKKIPFFWGWNISFIYNNEEYIWWYNGQITKNGQDCTEEALQKIFSSSL